MLFVDSTMLDFGHHIIFNRHHAIGPFTAPVSTVFGVHTSQTSLGYANSLVVELTDRWCICLLVASFHSKTGLIPWNSFEFAWVITAHKPRVIEFHEFLTRLIFQFT